MQYDGVKDYGAEHIKWILSQPRQKQEREYAYHLKLARGYRYQAESLFVQARMNDDPKLLQCAHLAVGFAKSEIEYAKKFR